jgi:GMP synthase (glutamine-hydrolysing)
MVLIIQNDPEVPPGTFATWLSELRVPTHLVNAFDENDLPPVAGASALIVLGGAMGAHETGRFPFLNKVKALINNAVRTEIPCLGICLGGQLLADVLGAEVHSGKNGERGLHSVAIKEPADRDPLFVGIPAVFPTFQWHDDCFEIPAGAFHLASSAVCPNQAFRYGAVSYGLQFHPELDQAIVATWARSGSSRILSDFLNAEFEYQAVSRTLLENFVCLSQNHLGR